MTSQGGRTTELNSGAEYKKRMCPLLSVVWNCFQHHWRWQQQKQNKRFILARTTAAAANKYTHNNATIGMHNFIEFATLPVIIIMKDNQPAAAI